MTFFCSIPKKFFFPLACCNIASNNHFMIKLCFLTFPLLWLFNNAKCEQKITKKLSFGHFFRARHKKLFVITACEMLLLDVKLKKF